MKERPILFSAPMIRAILAGAKVQTRRIVKPRHAETLGLPMVGMVARAFPEIRDGQILIRDGVCPYGVAGDRLWVQEGCGLHFTASGAICHYVADGRDEIVTLTSSERAKYNARKFPTRTTPGRFMYRSCSRIILAVESVRVERVQAISEEDARAEGVNGGCLECGNPAPCGCECPTTDYRDAFAGLWIEINGAASWDANPWVWVLGFKALDGSAK